MRKIKNTFAILTVVLMAFAMVTALSSCEPTHTHELTRVAEQPADCENGGVKSHYSCSGCDKLFTDEAGTKETTLEKLATAPLGHVERTILGTPATCEESGLSDGKYCSDCEKTLEEQTVIPATGHNEIVNPGFAATCDKDGLTDGKICGNCEVIFVARQVIPAIGHDWDDGQVSTPATCETAGEKNVTCKNDPTHTKKVEIPAIGHDWDDGQVSTPASCETAGEKTITCKNDPTHTKKVEIPAIGHDWDEGSVTSSATCTDEGTRVYTCKNDSAHTKSEVIPAMGHSAQKFDANPANCTENGNIEYWYCQVCNKYFSDADCKQEISANDTIVAAKGHSLYLIASGAKNEYEIGEDFDKANLVVKLDCNRCNHEEIITEYILSKETNLEAADGQITITYIKGETTYTATYNIVVKHTHNMTFVPAKDATCEENGIVEHYFCSVCNNGYSTELGADSDIIQDVVIPAINHAWSEISYEWSDDNKTCTALRVCGNDAYHNQSETVEVIVESELADCFKDGYTTYTASFTNSIFENQIKSEHISGGHNFENGVCKNNCGYCYLTLNNATLANEAGVLVDGTTNVYIVKAGTEVVIKADTEPKGKIFVGFDKNEKDNRVSSISTTLTITMGNEAVSYTAVYNDDLNISGANDKNALVSTGWGTGKYTEGSQSGVSSAMFKSGDKYTQYGYAGYTFTISSDTVLTDELIQNITRCNVKTLNNKDRVQRIAKVILKNSGAFGVTVELAFFRYGHFVSTGAVYVGAGESEVVYLELPLLVGDTTAALLGSFIVRDIDEGAAGSVTLDVAVGATRKYADATDDVFVTEDADLVNLETTATDGMGSLTTVAPNTDGDNRYFDNIGAIHWAYNASMFAGSEYRYIASKVAALNYTDGDEITIYARLLNYTSTPGMYDNEFEIFVYQGTADNPVELVRETVKLSEENGEVVVKLTFKPNNADGTIYLGAVKAKTTADAEANAAGVASADYNYNVIMQFAYNDVFGYEAD